MIRITAPYFVAGVILRGECVVDAAPIVRYMIGWGFSKVERYCIRKGWKWEVFAS